MINITCKIWGGLGNQLFVISTALSYAWKHKFNVFFKKDTTHISKQHCVEGYFENVFKKLNYEDKDTSRFDVYEEPSNEYNEIPKVNSDTMLCGYFQSDLYFKEYEKELKELFRIPVENVYRNMYPKKRLIAVHIRRGDYLDLYWVLDLDYFFKSVEYFSTKYDNCVFIVFTNDEEWCKSYLPWIIHKRGQDYIDMMLMSSMDGIIMANSTYSWWSSFLSDNAETVCPWVWYEGVNKHIIRDKWIINKNI